MSRMVTFLPVALVLLLALLAACGPSHPQETPDPSEPVPFTREILPRLDGSTSTAPLARSMCAVLLGESPEAVSDLVQFSRTTQSYRNLMAGEADLVLAAEPAPEVRSELEEGGKWLLTPFATDALVFVVNQDNPVDSLTVEEIQKIYTGEITNWSQVGGEDLAIAAFQRNPEAGSQTMFEKLVMDGLELMDPPAAWQADSMLGLLEGVRSYDNSPAAIGYTVYYYAHDMEMAQGLKVLKVDGVEPSPQSIREETYPFRNPYFAAIAQDTPADSPTRILYDWLLGPSGQRLAEQEGYVPITDPEEG